MLAKAYEVTDIKLTIEKILPPNLVIKVEGNAPTSGWNNFQLSPYVYIMPPADGIYDFDLIGEKPDGISSPAITCIEPPAVFVWEDFPEQEVKGVRVHASSNSLEKML